MLGGGWVEADMHMLIGSFEGHLWSLWGSFLGQFGRSWRPLLHPEGSYALMKVRRVGVNDYKS